MYLHDPMRGGFTVASITPTQMISVHGDVAAQMTHRPGVDRGRWAALAVLFELAALVLEDLADPTFAATLEQRIAAVAQDNATVEAFLVERRDALRRDR